MKNKISFLVMGLAALFLCPKVDADSGQITKDQYMPTNAVQAYSSTFSIRTDGMNWGSAQVVVTSVTSPAQTFNDGRASTASLTVASYAALSTATATGSFIVKSTAGAAGVCVSGGGPGAGSFNVCDPSDWTADVVSASMTACSLAAAINSYNVVTATCSTGKVSLTAVPGSAGNLFTINSSSPSAISTSVFSGGQDNVSLTVNGVTLTANKDFFPITSNAVTASAIVTAWNLSSGSLTVTMGTTGSVIGATTTAVGLSTRYLTAVSSQPALTLSPFTSSSTVTGGASGTMYGGTDSSFTINTSQINLPANTFGTGQQVLYTVGSTALTPLSAGTTYYVIQGTPNIQLALTSTGAVAGVPIVLTSSQVKTTADTYTLTPLAITGTPGISWAVSNDNLHWIQYTTTPFNVTIGSTTYGSYSASGTANNFDFGRMDYSYLGLSVTGPTTGAISVQAHVIGKE